MMNNIELYNLTKKLVGDRGASARKYCGLPAGAAWCCAFVCWIFHVGGDSKLFYGGKKVVYCPTAIQWCHTHLAQIPIYLAMPMDIIFFDWNYNNVPDHIGFVHERVSDQVIKTLEGNTNGGVVAFKTRPEKYVLGVFRPEFKADYKIGKLTIDGQFGYDSIAMLQKALGIKVDGILGRETVKALQKRVGAVQDGSWGKKTSKAVQKMVGTKVDGWFGEKSVKALQKWINKECGYDKTLGDKIADTAKSYVGKVRYKLGGTSLKTGIDCTGFIQAIYGLNGIHLDNKLSDWGKSIGTDLSKAKPGDILSFKDPKTGKIAHHAIYIGDGKCVHASTSHKDWHKDICISKVADMSKPLAGIRRRWK